MESAVHSDGLGAGGELGSQAAVQVSEMTVCLPRQRRPRRTSFAWRGHKWGGGGLRRSVWDTLNLGQQSGNVPWAPGLDEQGLQKRCLSLYQLTSVV